MELGPRHTAVLVVGDGLSDVASVLENRLAPPATVAHEQSIGSVVQALEATRANCVVLGSVSPADRAAVFDWSRERGTYCSIVECVPEPTITPADDDSYRPVTFHPDSCEALVDHVETLLAQRRREWILEALQETTPLLVRESTPEAIADQTVETAASVLRQPYTTVFEFDRREGHFEIVATTDERQARGNVPERLPVEDSLSGIAFRTQQPIAFDEADETPMHALEEVTFRHIGESEVLGDADHPMSSGLIVPLGTYGTLGIVAPEPAAFSVDDYRFVRILAENATAAFERSERERELERTNDRLETFSAIVSHDLRNPLAVATGNLDLLRMECEDERLDAVAESLGRMDDLIDDVLTLVRADIDEADTTWVAVGVVAQQAWETVETARGTLELSPKLSSVKATRGPFRELFENVFRNAVTHASEDVTVRVEPIDGGFAIEDDGPGVPTDELDRIFEYGYTNDEQGTGLGLAIVERIADAYGWSVEAGIGDDGGLRLSFHLESA